MTIYVFLFLLLLCSGFTPVLKRNKEWIILVFTLLALFFCFGYMTGSDWRSYETYYDYLSSSDFLEGVLLEPGYKIYSFFFESIGFSFWVYFIVTKLLLFGSVVYFIHKLSSKYSYLFCVTFFFFYFGVFLFIDNPMRNFIAVGISLFSYKYLINRQLFRYVLIVLLATSFHISAFLLLFIYFLYPLNLSKKTLAINYILFNFLFILTFRYFVIELINLFSFIPLVEYKMKAYFIEGNGLTQNSLFSIGFLFQLIVFILFLLKKESIENFKFGKLIFLGSILYLFLYRIGLTIEIFYRFQLYLSLLYSVGICLLLWTIYNYKLRLLYFSFIASFLLVTLIQTITSSEKYVPYTNYIQYMFEDMSFEERSQYNTIHSPYTRREQKNTK